MHVHLARLRQAMLAKSIADHAVDASAYTQQRLFSASNQVASVRAACPPQWGAIVKPPFSHVGDRKIESNQRR
jgi:hypothetical protein